MRKQTAYKTFKARTMTLFQSTLMQSIIFSLWIVFAQSRIAPVPGTFPIQTFHDVKWLQNNRLDEKNHLSFTNSKNEN